MHIQVECRHVSERLLANPTKQVKHVVTGPKHEGRALPGLRYPVLNLDLLTDVMLVHTKFLDATFDLLETLERRIVHAEVHQVFRLNVRVVAT